MTSYIDRSTRGHLFALLDLGDGPQMLMLQVDGLAMGELEPGQKTITICEYEALGGCPCAYCSRPDLSGSSA